MVKDRYVSTWLRVRQTYFHFFSDSYTVTLHSRLGLTQDFCLPFTFKAKTSANGSQEESASGRSCDAVELELGRAMGAGAALRCPGPGGASAMSG